jgi:hypothetical protein
LCRTRIRYTRLLIHLVGGDHAGGVEKGGIHLDAASMKWWISFSLRMSQGLVLEDSDRFKGSKATTGSGAQVLRGM